MKSKRISDLEQLTTPKNDDLLVIVDSGELDINKKTKKIKKSDLFSNVGGTWGSITGTLSNQTDLQTALNAKQNTITLTTVGTSGAATLIGDTLNIPQYSSGTPGGSDTYVQFNDSGTFGGDSGFTYNKTTDALTVNGLVHTPIVQAHTSAGLKIQAQGGTDSALFGAGGGANSTFYGGSKFDYATASTIAIFDASKNLISADTATYPSLTELSYVKGVTSAIQTQLNGMVTSVSGTTNRITSTGGTTPVIDISASYVGQNSITTLGTISTGVWNGTTIAIANGGTGQTTANDALNALLPSQVGNNTKVLQTDGSNTSWVSVGTIRGTGTSGQQTFWTGSSTVSGDNALWWDNTNKYQGIGTTTPSSRLDVTTNSLGTTQTATSGVALVNTTSATSGNPQISPALRLSGQAYDTVAGTSKQVDWQIYIDTKSAGGTNGNGNLIFRKQVAGGGYTNYLNIDTFTFTGNTQQAISGFNSATISGNITASGGNVTALANTATTSFDGFVATYNTATGATAGTPVKISTRSRWTGAAWTGAASQNADWIVETTPVSGTNPITSSWDLSSQINAGGYTKRLTVLSGGNVGIANTAPAETLDVTGTFAASSTIKAGATVRLKGYTVATLPAGTQGDTGFVSDALAPTFGATVVGGGAVVIPVFFDGTNWIVG